ncbi:MAG TPA: glycerophosphodiester phosphodiesterase [Armatimonadota bacterium]|nr:glycerophosphodiester phosphodiesterase [Armatimonadota bacterium]
MAAESNSFAVLRKNSSAGAPLFRVGHRGAGSRWPDNTIPSFEAAIKQGVDQLETDLRRCASGEIVLTHDDRLHTPNGAGPASSATSYSDLRKIDLGQGARLLTLDEFMEFCRGRCGVMLDLKAEGFERHIVDVLARSHFEPEQVIIAGASALSRQRLHEMAPQYALSLSLGSEPPGGIDEDFMDKIDTPAVTWQHPLLTPDRIEYLHARGKTVYAWTIDNEPKMRELIAAGADGIITNRPDLLNGVIAEIGAE